MHDISETHAQLLKEAEPTTEAFRKAGRHDIAEALASFDLAIADAAAKTRSEAIYTRAGSEVQPDPAEQELRRLRQERDSLYQLVHRHLEGTA